jgi:DNA-binding response OmpR family regulator
MNTSTGPSQQPVVLVITPVKPQQHDHTKILSQSGFQVLNYAHEDATVSEVLRLEPRIIIAELGDDGREATFNLVRRLKAHQLARHIPLIVFGGGLTAAEIETTAHAGAMWLQLEPTDGYKLLGAIRGVLRVA